jgi:release factor glutamine methyltransferase
MSPAISGEELYIWRQTAKLQAIKEGIDPQEIDWLLREFSDLDSLSLRLESFKTRSPIKSTKSLAQIKRLWQMRLQERWPVQYLAGTTPWRNFQLKVSPDVLIPRPETERAIDLVLEACRNSEIKELPCGNWVDLGTGSGAIALGLADVFPQATIYAVDLSPSALKIAKSNAATCEFKDRLNFYQGYWWEPLSFLKGKVSGMVSNPPYIPTQLIPQLQIEVRQHEPSLALDGGNDGLDCLRHLIETSPLYLQSGGLWFVEIMAGQAPIVAEMLERQGNYRNIKIIEDLSSIERFVIATRI